MHAQSMAKCSWCGAAIAPDNGYRAYEPAGERAATFCRLEHVVPWAINGPHWSAGPGPDADDRPGEADAAARCSRCGAELGDVRVLLVHHRGDHRIADGFCSVEHLRQWSAAGGRWG